MILTITTSGEQVMKRYVVRRRNTPTTHWAAMPKSDLLPAGVVALMLIILYFGLPPLCLWLAK